MRKRSIKRIFFYLIGGIIILTIIGLTIKFLAGKKTEKTFSQPKSLTPLNKLSDKELEKCLLEDFSRRLELKKYFVFNLRELTKEKVWHGQKINGKIVKKVEYSNSRKVNSSLAKDLTKLSSLYNCGEKNFVIFQDEKFSNSSNEWENEELDKKIDNGNVFIIFEKGDNIDYTYGKEAMGGTEYDWVFVRVKSPTTTICESKEKAFEILKTDPALQGKI